MVLVTGGTGFLGSYIIKNLVEKGHPVRAIRRSANLPFWIPASVFEKVEWVEGDVLDVISLDDAMQGVNAVVHAAAVVSFSKRGRRKMYSINVEGTSNVVNMAIQNSIDRFIHISSIAAIGRTTSEELVTEDKKWEENKNNTHYAISKHHAEMHVWRGFSEGLEGVVMNPSTILGFGNWHQSSCAIFKNVYKGFNWYSNGINGFVGVEDVAEASAQVLFSGINQRRFIVNSDNWVFRHLFNTIADGYRRKRPQKEATRTLGEIAWRLEALKSMITGKKPLLTKETAKVSQSKTSWDGSALTYALPEFHYTPLSEVIKKACEKYEEAIQKGLLSL